MVRFQEVRSFRPHPTQKRLKGTILLAISVSRRGRCMHPIFWCGIWDITSVELLKNGIQKKEGNSGIPQKSQQSLKRFYAKLIYLFPKTWDVTA